MKNLLILLTFIVANAAQADILGVRLSGGVFDYAVSGTLRDDASVVNELDLDTDLHIKDESESMVYLYIEHPVPLIPNIRLGTTSMKLAGSGNADLGFVYNGVTYTAVETLTTSIDLSHTEIGLYYEIIDTVVDLDLGLNFKLFSNKASITGSSAGTASTDIDGTIPMLYAALTIPLPAGFSIAGDISTVSYDGSTITDYLVRLRYETDFALGVEAGIRNFTIDYEDTATTTYADIKVSGPYLALHLAF